MKCKEWYCNTTPEQKGRGINTKHIYESYTVKFIIHATLTTVKMASQTE
jgi:hypothetical protein